MYAAASGARGEALVSKGFGDVSFLCSHLKRLSGLFAVRKAGVGDVHTSSIRIFLQTFRKPDILVRMFHRCVSPLAPHLERLFDGFCSITQVLYAAPSACTTHTHRVVCCA